MARVAHSSFAGNLPNKDSSSSKKDYLLNKKK